MRDVYKRGQLKVATDDIQSQLYSVAGELLAMYERRAAKGKTAPADTVSRDVYNILDGGMQRLVRVGGGVCHGLVYAWFASLREGRTQIDFDRDGGRWDAPARRDIGAAAAQNQAKMTARFLARAQTVGEQAAKSRAARKLASESGFDETEVCYAAVSRPAIDAVMQRVVTREHPRCYRISLKAAAGRHSIGLVRRGSNVFVLDPNIGIVFYDAIDKVVDDLTDVLTATDPERGYAARSIRVLEAEAQPIAEGTEESWEALLASLRAP